MPLVIAQGEVLMFKKRHSKQSIECLMHKQEDTNTWASHCLQFRTPGNLQDGWVTSLVYGELFCQFGKQVTAILVFSPTPAKGQLTFPIHELRPTPILMFLRFLAGGKMGELQEWIQANYFKQKKMKHQVQQTQAQQQQFHKGFLLRLPLPAVFREQEDSIGWHTELHSE